MVKKKDKQPKHKIIPQIEKNPKVSSNYIEQNNDNHRIS